jgi:hypothetical protein
MNPIEQRAYGAIRDSADPRDLPFGQAILPPIPESDHLICTVPGKEKVDMTPWLGPVKNQKNLGSCTGFANAGLREFLYRKYFDMEQHQICAPQDLILSPLFVYWWNRRNDGKLEFNDDTKYLELDRGASMRSGMRTLRWQGVCQEKEDPYMPVNFRVKPEVSDCERALLLRVGAYHSLRNMEDMKNCLRSGYAFTAAIDLYESFESDGVCSTGIIPIPKHGETLLGGHAILVVGFDDNKELFKVRNSWGAAWGDFGNFYLPYDFIRAGYMNSMWMAHLGNRW